MIAILITFGEETGWRGYTLPLLQRRHGAVVAALLVAPIWVVWHLPYFFTVATYRDFPPARYIGFAFSISCDSIVLTWLYNGTGGSILACAIWHGVYKPREWHRRRHRDDRCSHEFLRLRPSGAACRARVTRAQAWRSIDPRPSLA